jgi:Flp pilus assembly secretin CpaC
MKFSMAARLLVWLSASVCGAQEFSLQDDFGRVTGPYALQAGTEVAIGSNRLQLVNIQTQVVTVLPPGAPERELQVRRFPVRAAVMAGILEAAAAQAPDATNRSDQLKRLLVDVGVVWPAGSWISDLATPGGVRVCNTPANLDLIERLLQELGGAPRQIRLEVQFVAFDRARLNQLAVSGAGIQDATLTTLWTNGFGELLSAPTVTTKAGQEAIVRSGVELTYPTEFTIGGANQTNAANAYAAGAPCTVEPGGFQTRELGGTLQVVPEVSANGKLIYLTLNPMFTEEPVWHDYGPAAWNPTGQDRDGSMKQPFVHVYGVSTSVAVPSGKRVLIGGGMPTRDSKRAVYLFVTATVENEQGEPYRPLPDVGDHRDQPYDKSFTPRFALQDRLGHATGPYKMANGVALRSGANRAILTRVETGKKARPDGEFFVRRYTVPRSVCEHIEALSFDGTNSTRGGSTRQVECTQAAATRNGEAFKKTFRDLGVAWPDGSSLSYWPAFDKLFIRNTRENLRTLELIFEEFNCSLRQIGIEVQFVSFDRAAIARLAAAGTGFNTAALTALWTNGCGELLAAPMVVTRAGQVGMVKGVTEIIYPTSFTSVGVGPTNVSSSALAGGPPAVMGPGGFQTRETGLILQVVPEVSAAWQMINLTFNPQMVEEPVWESYGPAGRDLSGKERPAQISQPIFHVYSTSTSVGLAHGRRVLVGGGMPSRDGKRMVYLFVTATLLDEPGEVGASQDNEAL